MFYYIKLWKVGLKYASLHYISSTYRPLVDKHCYGDVQTVLSIYLPYIN